MLDLDELLNNLLQIEGLTFDDIVSRLSQICQDTGIQLTGADIRALVEASMEDNPRQFDIEARRINQQRHGQALSFGVSQKIDQILARLTPLVRPGDLCWSDHGFPSSSTLIRVLDGDTSQTTLAICHHGVFTMKPIVYHPWHPGPP